MPHRDPATGKFVSSQSVGEVEYVTWMVQGSVPAADLDGTTSQYYGENANFEGVQLYDLDQIVDRHEVGSVLHAQHRVALQPTGTQTADSAALLSVEVSSSPARKEAVVSNAGQLDDMDDQSGDFAIESLETNDDSLDLLGRPLVAMAQGPFTDGTNGLGGGGGPGHDDLDFAPVAYDLDRRDEMFLNGGLGVQNISDGPVTFQVTGQHVLSVVEE